MRKRDLDNLVALYRKKVELASSWTNDADALECVELFPRWEPDRYVILGERLQYNDILYKCIQPHTTQEQWTPDITPALWRVVSVDEWPEWIQPTGAADAYMTGDKVSYNGNHYISDIDNNVWTPGVYGWTMVE